MEDSWSPVSKCGICCMPNASIPRLQIEIKHNFNIAKVLTSLQRCRLGVETWQAHHDIKELAF
jgi:hypothetical protein